MASLNAVARKLVAPGKGILAADESEGTIAKRFAAIELPVTLETRRDYREMLFRSTDAMQKYISGVILTEETLLQSAADGTPFREILKNDDCIPGIKVDRGAFTMPGSADEKITEGLDGLRQPAHALCRGRRRLRQVARRHRDHPQRADPQRHPRQRPRPRPLRRALPGGRHRAGGRARGAGRRRARRPLDRALRGGHRRSARDGVHRTAARRRRSRRHAAQAEHGAGRLPLAAAPERRGSRASAPSRASRRMCRRRCPASPSSPAARATRRRPRTSRR